MNVLIVDDDVNFCYTLKRDLTFYFETINDRTQFYIISDVPFHFQLREKYDLAFIDIDLKGIDGIQVAKEIRNSGLCRLIIFVTSHDHLVYNSLTVHPFFFIRKKEYEDDLKVFFDLISDAFQSDEFITLKWHGNRIVINTKDIIYIESINHSLLIHTIKGDYCDSRLLKEMMKNLNIYRFAQIYKSYVINFDFLMSYNSTSVQMVENKVLTIGRSYKQHFIKSYEKYLENDFI